MGKYGPEKAPYLDTFHAVTAPFKMELFVTIVKDFYLLNVVCLHDSAPVEDIFRRRRIYLPLKKSTWLVREKLQLITIRLY